MNAGFQPRFVPLVREGSKTHTIRGGKRWRPGMRADLYENYRQKKVFNARGLQIGGSKLIFRAPCIKVEDIRVEAHEVPGRLNVWINDVRLSYSEKSAFFWRDGFREEGIAPENQAAAFWADQLAGGKVFEGQVIHWDYKRLTLSKPKPEPKRRRVA